MYRYWEKQPKPVAVNIVQRGTSKSLSLEELLKALGADGFDDIIAGTEIAREGDVLGLGGAAEDDDFDRVQQSAFLHPAEDVKTAEARHFQIEKDEVGRRVKAPIGESVLVLQIIQR